MFAQVCCGTVAQTVRFVVFGLAVRYVSPTRANSLLQATRGADVIEQNESHFDIKVSFVRESVLVCLRSKVFLNKRATREIVSHFS